MSLTLRRSFILALTGLASCHAPWDPLVGCQEYDACTTSSGTSGGSRTTGDDHTTTGDSGANASTDDGADATSTGDAGSSSTGTPADDPPQVFAFTLTTDDDTPGQIFAAGEIQLDLHTSDDVVEVDVLYGDTLVATLPIASFPYAFDITSQTMCDGARTFTAIVRDAAGQTDMATADLYCQLPAPGSEQYTRTYPGASDSNGAAVATLPDGHVVVAGTLDGRMTLWRLDPGGNVAPNWPRTLAGWTMDPSLAAKESSATAVSIDATGAIFVGGTIKSGTTTRRYLAKLSDQGALLWEDVGIKDGEEISSLSTSATGDTVAAGSVRTSPLDQLPRYDWGTWGYPKQGPQWTGEFVRPDTDLDPDPLNLRSERARAVLALPDGDFMVLGEREYFSADWEVYSRATGQRYTSSGARDGDLWTSQGLKFLNDAAVAATLTDIGFAAAGWCRHWQVEAIRQVCVQEFDANGVLVGFHAEPSPTHAEARALAQDREHKLVMAGFSTKPNQADAWVFASAGGDHLLAWAQTYDSGGWGLASGVTCDPWGHCTWVGTTTVGDMAALVVSRRNP